MSRRTAFTFQLVSLKAGLLLSLKVVLLLSLKAGLRA